MAAFLGMTTISFLKPRKIFELNMCICLFLFILAVLSLHGCTQAFSSCGEWGFSPVVVRGPLIVVASLVVEDGL